jgi:hypothetical protein
LVAATAGASANVKYAEGVVIDAEKVENMYEGISGRTTV